MKALRALGLGHPWLTTIWALALIAIVSALALILAGGPLLSAAWWGASLLIFGFIFEITTGALLTAEPNRGELY